MKHLRKFNTSAERDAYVDETPILEYPYVHYIAKSKSVLYSGPEVDVPFYFENISGLVLKFSNTFEYSRNGVDWTAGTSSTSITFSSNERVYFRAIGLTASSSSGIGKFTISAGTCNIGGNLMSMLYGADYRGKTEINQQYAFYNLFENQKGIISARFLALPAITLTSRCYSNMFYGCSNLVHAPALPAMNLADNCYYGMFYECTSLVVAPELPAITLANYCYGSMFYGCTSLVSGPPSIGSIVSKNCCYQMFKGCTSLVHAPALPAITLADSCYSEMFRECKSLTETPRLVATTVGQRSYYGMFWGCTSLLQASDLSVINFPTELENSFLSYGRIGPCCYMFKGCTSLVHAPALPATTLPEGCYNSMFEDCTSLVDAPVLPATTLAGSCYAAMFSGCTALIKAPELPAESLAYSQSGAKYYGCYHRMFYGCSSLNYIKAMFTYSPGSKYTEDWVNGVASTGTFVKNSSAAWDVTGTNGVPSGWTVVLETPSV